MVYQKIIHNPKLYTSSSIFTADIPCTRSGSPHNVLHSLFLYAHSCTCDWRVWHQRRAMRRGFRIIPVPGRHLVSILTHVLQSDVISIEIHCSSTFGVIARALHLLSCSTEPKQSLSILATLLARTKSLKPNRCSIEPLQPLVQRCPWTTAKIAIERAKVSYLPY